MIKTPQFLLIPFFLSNVAQGKAVKPRRFSLSRCWKTKLKAQLEVFNGVTLTAGEFTKVLHLTKSPISSPRPGPADLVFR